MHILFVLFLVFLNGFFVAAEFSLVAVQKTKIDALKLKGNKAAALVSDALENIDHFISATQLGITIASLGLGWVGEPFLANLIRPFFGFLPTVAQTVSSHSVSTAVAFLIITFLHIVLGELAPKTVALQKPQTVSLFIIAPILAFTKVFSPFIVILNGAGNIVLKLFGLQAPSRHGLVHSEEEIRLLLDQGGRTGVIPKEEVEMVQNVFKLGEIPIKQIMIPRTDILSFSQNSTIGEVLKKINISSHSRFPVFSNTIDSIVGFIHIKDIYGLSIEVKTDIKLVDSGIIREILYVPERKKADEVLLDMQRNRIHLAVVNDEYGGTAGIVTLEDVLESLVGEIEDEFERPLRYISKEKDGSYCIDARIPLTEFQKRFKLPLKGQGYTTIGGLVFGLLGRDPKENDKVQLGENILTIEKVNRQRIYSLRLKKAGRRDFKN